MTQYKWVKASRNRLKMAAVKSLGEKCAICGFSAATSVACLSFHHVDPSTKAFNISGWTQRKRATIADELRKCVLLCMNCHTRLHAGELQLPTNAVRFDEAFANFTTHAPIEKTCEQCGHVFSVPYTDKKKQRFCSVACVTNYRNAHWHNIQTLLDQGLSVKDIAALKGVGYGAVWRQLKLQKKS